MVKKWCKNGITIFGDAGSLQKWYKSGILISRPKPDGQIHGTNRSCSKTHGKKVMSFLSLDILHGINMVLFLTWPTGGLLQGNFHVGPH